MALRTRRVGALAGRCSSSLHPIPDPLALAVLEGARAAGITTYQSPNGEMMEAAAGASLTDLRVRDGQRQSVSAPTRIPSWTSRT